MEYHCLMLANFYTIGDIWVVCIDLKSDIYQVPTKCRIEYQRCYKLSIYCAQHNNLYDSLLIFKQHVLNVRLNIQFKYNVHQHTYYFHDYPLFFIFLWWCVGTNKYIENIHKHDFLSLPHIDGCNLNISSSYTVGLEVSSLSKNYRVGFPLKTILPLRFFPLLF